MNLNELTAAENSLSPEEAELGLGALLKSVAACEKCTAFCQGRSLTVFGEGPAQPEIVFVGDAPGAEEDLAGRPFVGPAGQLLTKIIEAAGLRRESVYLCNILKCRPPEGHAPTPTEITNCLPYLKTQIGILRPKVLVALGGFAAGALLQSTEKITQLRGQTHFFEDIPLICTFHPAYLLHSSDKKKDVWEDMKRLLKLLGRPIEPIS